MNEAGAVGRGEALAGLAIDRDDRDPVADVLADPGAERRTGDVLHRQEHAVLPDGDVVHGDDVGMREAGDRSRLAEQPGAGLGRAIAARRVQQLDGDTAVELGVVTQVDLAHAARAQQLEHDEAADLVAASQPPGAGFGVRRLAWLARDRATDGATDGALERDHAVERGGGGAIVDRLGAIEVGDAGAVVRARQAPR